MFLPAEVQKQPQINAAIAEATAEFAPSVKYIRYTIDQDWAGDWAVYFRVLLSDEAARERLGETGRSVRRFITDRMYVPYSGLIPYFNFRSESEQAKLRDPIWEPLVVQ